MDAFNMFGWYVLVYFFGLGIIEAIWHWRTGRIYSWRDSAASIADMAIRRTILFAIGGNLLLWVSPWLHQFSLGDLPLKTAGAWNWPRLVGLFFGVEFFYYWHHRWSHEVRWFWATHAVHHSPNSMNFLTAERLGWTQNVSGAILVFTPLVLVGFRPEEVLGMFSLNLLYQYWLHTEMIGKLGWFELVFNTPSHHRVHHASNPTYLDANFGGVVIIFDRLFRTLVPERNDEKVVFGLVKPLRSINPIYIALHEWLNVARDISHNWRHPQRLLGYVLGRPGWSHDGSRATSAQIAAHAGLENKKPKGVCTA